MPHQVRRVLLAAALLPIAGGCGGYRAVEQKVTTRMEWPANEPRIRLQGLIDLQAGSGGAGKFVKWLGVEGRSDGFRRPFAVAWLEDDLFVADPDAARVARIEPGGKVTLSPDGMFETPIGVAACRRGVVVTDVTAGRVGVLDETLSEVQWIAEGFARPTGVACRGDRVYVAETGEHRVRLSEIDGTWRELGRRGSDPGEFNFPTSITLDEDSFLVGDTLNFRIQRFDDSTGRFLGEFGRIGDSPGEMPRSKDVAVDRDGRVWVSDGHLDRISFYDRDGAFLMSIGGTGSGPGEFTSPAGIAAHPDGRVAVVDSLNRRLHIFRVLDGASSPEGD